MTMTRDKIDVDQLANEIRRVDGSHSLGAGALAEALMPFITRALADRALEPQGQELPEPWIRDMDAPEGSRDHFAADQMHDFFAQGFSAGRASQLALPAGPVPEEDGYEMRKAMMEGEMAASADGYFKARTNLMDTTSNRHLFRAGFERGYEIGNCDRSIGTSLLSPAVAHPVADEPTEYQVMKALEKTNITPEQSRDFILTDMSGKRYPKAWLMRFARHIRTAQEGAKA